MAQNRVGARRRHGVRERGTVEQKRGRRTGCHSKKGQLVNKTDGHASTLEGEGGTNRGQGTSRKRASKRQGCHSKEVAWGRGKTDGGTRVRKPRNKKKNKKGKKKGGAGVRSRRPLLVDFRTCCLDPESEKNRRASPDLWGERQRMQERNARRGRHTTMFWGNEAARSLPKGGFRIRRGPRRITLQQ